MKNVLRASGVVAAFALTALSTANAQLPGTCRTRCSTGAPPFTTVTWSASESACCSGTRNPCPAGSTPVFSTWAPYGGLQQICGPQS